MLCFVLLVKHDEYDKDYCVKQLKRILKVVKKINSTSSIRVSEPSLNIVELDEYKEPIYVEFPEMILEEFKTLNESGHGVSNNGLENNLDIDESSIHLCIFFDGDSRMRPCLRWMMNLAEQIHQITGYENEKFDFSGQSSLYEWKVAGKMLYEETSDYLEIPYTIDCKQREILMWSYDTICRQLWRSSLFSNTKYKVKHQEFEKIIYRAIRANGYIILGTDGKPYEPDWFKEEMQVI